MFTALAMRFSQVIQICSISSLLHLSDQPFFYGLKLFLLKLQLSFPTDVLVFLLHFGPKAVYVILKIFFGVCFLDTLLPGYFSVTVVGWPLFSKSVGFSSAESF